MGQIGGINANTMACEACPVHMENIIVESRQQIRIGASPQCVSYRRSLENSIPADVDKSTEDAIRRVVCQLCAGNREISSTKGGLIDDCAIAACSRRDSRFDKEAGCLRSINFVGSSAQYNCNWEEMGRSACCDLSTSRDKEDYHPEIAPKTPCYPLPGYVLPLREKSRYHKKHSEIKIQYLTRLNNLRHSCTDRKDEVMLRPYVGGGYRYPWELVC